MPGEGEEEAEVQEVRETTDPTPEVEATESMTGGRIGDHRLAIRGMTRDRAIITRIDEEEEVEEVITEEAITKAGGAITKAEVDTTAEEAGDLSTPTLGSGSTEMPRGLSTNTLRSPTTPRSLSCPQISKRSHLRLTLI